MHTIEFESYSHNGVIKIPESYQEWFGKSVKVTLSLLEEPEVQGTDSVLRRLPKGTGGYHSGRSDVSERVEELLFQTKQG